MVLQYVAASFHLPSVSTANIKTVQYAEVSNELLPQSIMAAFFEATAVVCLTSLQAYQHTEIHVTQFTFLFIVVISCWNFGTQPKMSNCKYTAVCFILSMPTDLIIYIRHVLGKELA